MTDPTSGLPRITELAVKNYRVLRDVRFTGLTPLTALLGPNGSGKSTVLDVLHFLTEAADATLWSAWSRRVDGQGIRSFGTSGPVEIELTATPGPGSDEFRYHLSLDGDELVVRREELFARLADRSEWSPLLVFRDGVGSVYPGGQGTERLAERGALALTTFGGLDRYPAIVHFRRFLVGLRLSRISLDAIRAGASMSTSTVPFLHRSAQNLPQMVQYLRNEHPDTFDVIIRSLRRYVPNLANVQVERWQDELTLRIKDTPFEQLTVPESTSDGTLKLLAYLVSLWEPNRYSVLMLEEPENFVHHRLLHLMAEDARIAAERGQILVATHSPYFVDALRPDEVWMTYRGADGFTRVRRAADVPRLVSMVESGGSLGDLWTEGYFDQGDPLAEPS